MSNNWTPRQRSRGSRRRGLALSNRWPTSGPAGNLPRELTSFVGRQSQLAEIAQLLQTSLLLTLVGIGGIGKTRLALQAARCTRDRYAHGAWLVELARTSDPSAVAGEVARVLGVRERPGWNSLETLCSVLRGRQLLLVLDNCEHVVAACAEVAAALLQRCPDLSILATSREPLGVGGEAVYHVPPLSVPTAGDTLDDIPDGEAVELLIDRVRAVEPEFRLTPRLAGSAARICRLVEGLPLGIELAAARTTTMSLDEIARRLLDPFTLLTLGPRSAPARQRTLYAAIDWSYGLLTRDEQVLLRRLAVFTGGFTRQAAAAVCAGNDLPETDIDNLLDRLLAQSLIVRICNRDRLRFSMLDTVRRYSRSRLEEAHELAILSERHRDWCLSLVAGVVTESLNADDIARLEPELDNLHAALRWTIDNAQVEAATRLVLGLASSWFFHGSFNEGRCWLTTVLDLGSEGCTSSDRARVAAFAGSMALNQGDYAASESLFQRALDLAKATRDVRASTFAESRLGRLAYQRGDLLGAKDFLERSLRHVADGGNLMESISLGDLGFTYLELGDTARAAALFRAASESATPAQARFLEARLLNARAHLADRAGDYAEADRLLAMAVDAERVIGDQPGLVESLTIRGVLAVQRGDRQLAAELLLESLDLADRFGSRLRLSHLLEALATLLVDWQPEACVGLAAAAAQLRQTLGAPPLPSEQARLGPSLQRTRNRLGQRRYAAIWAAASTVPLQATLTEARQLVQAFQAGRPSGSTKAVADAQALSRREREVAMLVTRGLNNREIAEELFVTAKTAESHINHILNKLGLSNRVQIATWGMRHGLAPALEVRPTSPF